MMETQQQDLGAKLQAAVLQAAMPSEAGSAEPDKKQDGNVKKRAVSPLTGTPVPGGRPKGVQNKMTVTIRDAVMEAFKQVGGPAYLVKLAEGTQSDRAAFTSLLNKVLPTQINANVEGGIQVQLSWLGQRQIGTTQTQPAEVVTQVIDLERDSKGKYRISNQDEASKGAGPDPLPPLEPGAGASK